MNKNIIKTITLALTIGTLSTGNVQAMEPMLSPQLVHEIAVGLAIAEKGIQDLPFSTATVTTVLAAEAVAIVAVPLMSYSIGKKVSQYIKKSSYLKAAGLYGATLLTAFGLDKINENTFNDHNLPGKVAASLVLGGVSLSLKIIPSIMALNAVFKKALKLESNEAAEKTAAA